MTFVAKWFGFGVNANFDRGLRAYEAKAYGEAASHFRMAVESEQNERIRERAASFLAGSLARLGKASLAKNDADEALEALEPAVHARPNFADVRVALAQALTMKGRYDEALSHLDAAIEINPRYGLATMRRAGVRILKGDHETGWAEAQAMIAQAPGLKKGPWDEVSRAVNEGRWEDAGQTLSVYSPPTATDVPELIEEYRLAMLDGEHDKAIASMRHAIELAPSFPDLHVRLGEALFESGQLEESAACFRQAIELHDGYADAHSLLGITLRRMGREDEASRAFQTAIRIDPRNLIATTELDFDHTDSEPAVIATDDDEDE